ncbi:hypothetical protein LJC32_06045 [Oscillospiraceae bacterium OttesenSCG-928-F05]|nr:hypothetical protein [Oscillospiraceae bacterium OttesenSCG-928-F05]
MPEYLVRLDDETASRYNALSAQANIPVERVLVWVLEDYFKRYSHWWSHGILDDKGRKGYGKGGG